MCGSVQVLVAGSASVYSAPPVVVMCVDRCRAGGGRDRVVSSAVRPHSRVSLFGDPIARSHRRGIHAPRAPRVASRVRVPAT
mmetsp:Transcript_10315/g.23592  ORF Transcript_10315/g.23592 Transcript_10315/m.23592 type:complete len:82 (+) Transcript_10315:857-1102(+)